LSFFEVFAGRTNASGGPHAARVFETPYLEQLLTGTEENISQYHTSLKNQKIKVFSKS
jgi:hypothetical protein